MNIQYCSDLHLEFLDNRKWVLDNPIDPKGDILILAGDIVLFKEMHQHQKFFDYVSEHFEHTFWIPGNHEYYNSDITKRSSSFEEQIRHNVTLLNNTVKTIDGVRFVFSTLWSQISTEKQFIIQQSLSDFRVIRNNEKRLTVDDYNQIHSECRLFLEETLKNKTKIPTVVITHHPPTFMNYPEKYANSTINEAFGTEMFNFIEDSEIDYWIYGHHHCNVSDFTIGKTKLVTNQLGYIKYHENEYYRNDAVFSI
ncbi:metallophosphoesterase [Flavobacterium sp. TAB 87]|uniref:metallophosphoesterase n=1 Tax=Flavobacterium sp. TAB 87 TaxID=1729581 RepID=UPI00076CF077|nr:metallophosphoesterase [Flavobacterium sp. TAB 87]KVV16427.1 putative phosphoesterase [Flavobacterium sp. TAB 87]